MATRRRISIALGVTPPSVGLGLAAALAAAAAGTLTLYPLKSVAPVVSLGVVYIPGANLRRKIEPEDGPRYVLTDPGVGYRFAA